MSTTQAGREAESTAAAYLQKLGYNVVSQNWRTRWCEIDLVAVKQGVVYFAEVKYRKSASWGDGLDAITAAKQRQMLFAAEFWVAHENWYGDARLLAISVSGTPPMVNQLIEL